MKAGMNGGCTTGQDQGYKSEQYDELNNYWTTRSFSYIVMWPKGFASCVFKDKSSFILDSSQIKP